VLYRMRPTVKVVQVGSVLQGRVRYSRLKGAARGEALMQIQWCWVYERGFGKCGSGWKK
jgi:hypothetical protein